MEERCAVDSLNRDDAALASLSEQLTLGCCCCITLSHSTLTPRPGQLVNGLFSVTGETVCYNGSNLCVLNILRPYFEIRALRYLQRCGHRSGLDGAERKGMVPGPAAATPWDPPGVRQRARVPIRTQ